MNEPKRLGRPPKPDSKKRQQIGVRTSPDLKELLEHAATSNGRSVAQEAEIQLLESFKDEERAGSRVTLALMRHLTALATDVQIRTGKAWHESYSAWFAFREAIDRVLAAHTPPIPNRKALDAALAREAAAKERLDKMKNFLQREPLQAEYLAATNALAEAAAPAIRAREAGKRVATQLPIQTGREEE